MHEDQSITIEPVMENITRLVEDATLLMANDRLPSAYVLSVIALEEVGKIVQMRWQHLGQETTRQNRTGHLQKQWAVACVLIADKLLPFFKAMILGPEDQKALAMAEMAEGFINSDERRFFEEVIAKNIDRGKQLGLYEDESNAREGRTRDQIDHATIKQVSDTILKASALLANDIIMMVSSVLYEVMPPFQEAILRDRDKY
ncbi:AbiV family abortive infection protein [Novosphingobium sp. PhB165]|uniref:AbiV family abortive infection protein n=1 Tax=Novosphingobium sp. PhB165 TaxID=2485105 RepID=UPI001049F22F|nr:AbiV family abortive infection protein [Novosphingobium sp. PhB165]TCM19046.1 AbiV family abortive infection protein [Novosphingobium sp. PhB165]